jgi:NAD(P)-dependent dehydrogenase (short-subunit alcohol dehydrogenase family)
MSGRVLITGGSRGIGHACAQRLAAEGWRVTIAARDAARVEAAVAALPGSGHAGIALDVADVDAWTAVTAPDALVCAAGVIGPIGRADMVDPQAFLDTYAVNVGGVFNAVHALRLTPATPIVAFSGGGATSPMARFDAYAASKAALVRLVENLAADGWRINAVAPGFVVTELQQEVLDAGAERVGDAYFARVSQAVAEGGGEDPSVAAACVSWLLSPGAEGVSGRLIAARWDAWRDGAFAQRARDDADFATLRRIDEQFFTKVPT